MTNKVGIVIVSHSAKLAAGVEELARQMTQTPVPIALAAGINDPENSLGTDALQIQAAIESVYSEAGVIVLMDLGSAVMNAEMALEFLPEHIRKNVRLCEAPLVEGAVVAVVEAASDANLERVLSSARDALSAKVSQLGKQISAATGQNIENLHIIPNSKVLSRKLTVLNQNGLHIRPAAKLVTTAAQFQSEIKLQNLTTKSQPCSAKSINQLLLLGVRQGHEIAITAEGEDAEVALAALQKLIEEQLDQQSSPTSLKGIPASPGMAIAPVFFNQATIPEVIDEKIDNPNSEWQRLQQAIGKAKEQLENLASSGTDEINSIFAAHLLYLQDSELIERAHHFIFEQNLSAAVAWKNLIEEVIASYQALTDPFLQARTNDIEDIGIRVLRILTGIALPTVNLNQAGILIAVDLTVSEVAQLKSEQVKGICTVEGSATAHTSLLANQLGIPMIVGIGQNLLSIAANTELAIDGATGQIWIEPSKEECQNLLAKSKLSGPQKIPAEVITLDDRTIPVLANIGGLTNVQYALDCGAQGVGLLRTELLYLARTTPPTEEEQLETIEAIGAIMGDYPLTIRTLDIGGDKPVSYLNLPPEKNPFLGVRGIRQSLAHPEILKTQLRAILRASARHKIKLMFPMISSVKEVRAAKQLVSQVQAELKTQGISFNKTIPIGIMIEVPAAVIIADQLAAEVDFFSLGTNDLSQYLMAADRTNSQVAALADAFEPAVLRLIQQTVKAAHAVGIKVSICGQLASDPTAVGILLGLGVDELSVNPQAIPAIKAEIVRQNTRESEAKVNAILQLDSADSVKDYLLNWSIKL
jgi:phosphocarrier protein FPr